MDYAPHERWDCFGGTIDARVTDRGRLFQTALSRRPFVVIHAESCYHILYHGLLPLLLLEFADGGA